jgi:hypothetical protein
MNLEHLKAVIWLRWRLRSNQFKKAGTLNAVIFSIITVMALVSMVGLFIAGTLVGGFLLPRASPLIQMYVWDGLIAAVIFSWSIGLLTDLQRAESLALDRFMHLPISLKGVFLINYLSSLATLATAHLASPAVIGGLLVGHDRPHVSVSRLARLADVEPPPSSNGDRDRDDEFRFAGAISAVDSRRSTVGNEQECHGRSSKAAHGFKHSDRHG